jgi:hypothetical protein
MNLTKSETNNAIVTKLGNVRKHPNADRLKLATVLGTQVIVGEEAYDGQVVLYFDSNLCLSPSYLSANNLYADPSLNVDKTKKGYFGGNGRVKCQKFRGELSNGFVAELSSLLLLKEIYDALYVNYDSLTTDFFNIGDEFTHVCGVEICKKYIIPECVLYTRKKYKNEIELGVMFKRHWDTKQFIREYQNIPPGICWIEEKIHGTSGRTGYVEVIVYRKWYQIWKPKTQKEWKVVSGTRKMDHTDGHISSTRKEIHNKLAPHLHKGETLYYEIFGHSLEGKGIQTGFNYGCFGGEYKVMLYRVTITTSDGFSVDLPREAVYKRAEELGLIKPFLIGKVDSTQSNFCDLIQVDVKGISHFANHIKEGVVVWFMNTDGTWSNLKHKSEEFLLLEDRQRDKDKGDPEDSL